MRIQPLILLLSMCTSGLTLAQSVELRVTGVIQPSGCETQVIQPTLSALSLSTPYTFQCQPGNNAVLRQAYTPDGAKIDMTAARGKPGETHGQLTLHRMPATGAHNAYLEVYYY